MGHRISLPKSSKQGEFAFFAQKRQIFLQDRNDQKFILFYFIYEAVLNAIVASPWASSSTCHLPCLDGIEATKLSVRSFKYQTAARCSLFPIRGNIWFFGSTFAIRLQDKAWNGVSWIEKK